MVRQSFILLIYLIGLFTLSACDPSYIDSKERRIELAKKNQGDIVIGVAWSFEDNDFVKGAQLAVEEINASKEGFFKNRKIKLLQKNDVYKKGKDKNLALERQKERDLVTKVTRAFTSDPTVIAVIGHRQSLAATPASINYQYHGIVFLAPTATNSMLTNHQFNYVFRLIPNNAQIGKQLVDYCVKAGYKKMAVLYARNTYAEELGGAFIGHTVSYDKDVQTALIEIAFTRSFFGTKGEFSDMLADLKEANGKLVQEGQSSMDAIFIATSAEAGGKLIRQIRSMGISLPIVGADAMHSKLLWDESQERAQGTVVPALLNEEKGEKFFQKYKTRYPDISENPDPRAVLGYDAIKLLANAMRTINSTVPITLATAIRYLPPFQGITGGYKFDENGDLVNKELYFKALCNGQFKTVKYNASGEPEVENCEKPIQPGDLQDIDKDGIVDKEDACPNNTLKEVSEGVYPEGTRKGCPVDNDEDGIMDYLDECQAVSQLENLKGVDEKGCPVDIDQDGLPDYEDECLETPIGIEVNNQGCAVVEELKAYILSSSTEPFFSGDTLTNQGKKVLEETYEREFSKILEEHDLNNIEVIGYTDSRGSEEQNLKVSEKRAQYVADYLIEKGVDVTKITVQGKGKTQPIDTNETSKGRANNRRVEIKVFVLKKKKLVEEETESTEEKVEVKSSTKTIP